MTVIRDNSTNCKTRIFAPLSIIRIGLGLVFLANAWVAIFQPDEFTELIEASVIGSILPVATDTVTKIIAVNDTVVALFLIFGVGGQKLYAWATIWITGALVIIGQPIEMLEESGLLAIAIALFVSQRKYQRKAKKVA